MKLYLIKHGETTEGKRNIILGLLPGTLTEPGKKYAENASRQIKSLPIMPTKIISSDLTRAKNTAEIIAKATKLSLTFEPLLRERGAGAAEGKTDKQID